MSTDIDSALIIHALESYVPRCLLEQATDAVIEALDDQHRLPARIVITGKGQKQWDLMSADDRQQIEDALTAQATGSAL